MTIISQTKSTGLRMRRAAAFSARMVRGEATGGSSAMPSLVVHTNVAIPDDQSQIIAKCLAEVIGQQPSKDDVLGLLVKAFEKAVDN